MSDLPWRALDETPKNGRRTGATQPGTIAIGSRANAAAEYALAIGRYATAGAERSMALG
ncbi:hypothetical protein [Burkholderia cenocepacia]|uniref:hypothetical protein n=1 Tax=Burkholderia cenocepacia TaxID=95486 RepID=UPI00098222DD|nr:hypothetical protein [Burkholderia cenocepacia]QKT92181.1 hypothetical protein FOC42_10870 [Burkholderia cenocepacia]HEF5181460.1 hypothetical protein [Burkholderia cenocepacia]